MTQGHGGEICASVWSRLVWGSGGGGRWDFRFFGFGHFLGRFFGFCNEKRRFFGFVVRCGFRFFPFLASGFRFFGKNNAVFRILVTDVDFGFSNLEGRQRRRQTCTGSQCGFCGCVALSTAFKLQFCSYKHVFSDMIGGPKNCFQQRLIFYFRLQFAINFFEDLVPLGDTGKAILIVSL